MPDQVVPANAEWSRSRFWLCHFLHQRHLRKQIEFDDSSACGLEPTFADWIARGRGVESARSHAIIRHATRQGATDPAYVQSLRLLFKEQRFHRQLLGRLSGESDASRQPLPQKRGFTRPTLGMRFELSILFIDDLLLIQLLDAALPTLRGPSREVFLQMRSDRRAHLAFYAERLTREYAAFNVLRRNLRRARLRAMFRVMLTSRQYEDARFLYTLGQRPDQFARHCQRDFTRWLERIVPYRREALVRSLLNQVERPYDQPEG